MKKQAMSILAVMAMFFICGSVMAASTVKYDVAGDVPHLGSGSGHMLTAVIDDGAEVVVTLTNVRFTPIGVDTKGDNLTTDTVLALYSGIMDAKGVKEPFVIAKVVGGKATFRIPNSARVVGVPVVEHFWGRSADGRLALVHDPADPFVVSNNGDLDTLAIGIVMYPNSRTVSLKPFGKLDQGKHPELAK